MSKYDLKNDVKLNSPLSIAMKMMFEDFPEEYEGETRTERAKSRRESNLTPVETMVLLAYLFKGKNFTMDNGKVVTYCYLPMRTLSKFMKNSKNDSTYRNVRKIVKRLEKKEVLVQVEDPKETIPGFKNNRLKAYEANWDKIIQYLLIERESMEKYIQLQNEEPQDGQCFIEKSPSNPAKSEEEQLGNQQATDYPQHSTAPQFVANEQAARDVLRGKITVSQAIEKLNEQGISPDVTAWKKVIGDGSEEVQEIEKYLKEYSKSDNEHNKDTPARDKETPKIEVYKPKELTERTPTSRELEKRSELEKRYTEYSDLHGFDSNIIAMARMLTEHENDDESVVANLAKQKKQILISSGAYVPPMWQDLLSAGNVWKVTPKNWEKLEDLQKTAAGRFDIDSWTKGG